MYQSLNVSDLRPGDILLFRMGVGSFNIWERCITGEERDTDVCHAAYVGANGDIWSTGTRKMLGIGMLFGSIGAHLYLSGRSCYVARFDILSDEQIATMDANGKRCEGMRYGLEKVLILMQKAKLGGVVRRLYPWLTKVVTHPFCSEQVADSCWRAGYRVCESMGKEEPSAITPANLKTFAEMKGTNLNIIGVING